MNRLLLLLFIALSPAGFAQQLDVMTYNIRYDNAGDGINRWDSRKEKVFDLIKEHDPDILGVQEALHHQLEDIVAANPAYVFVGAGRDDGKQKGEYSAVLYKKDLFDVIEQNTFWLSETPEVPGSKSWDAAITRVATWARLKDRRSGKEFLVINTHFDHIGKIAREKSAALLKSKARALAGDRPVVITGDFNVTRDDLPYKVIMEATGLALNDPAGDDPPGTFCNFGVGSMKCRSIDYIFLSGHWRARDYVVITDNDGKNYPSDHLPVMVSISLL